MLLTVFDPWKSQLCTCPNKLTFNPYTGCDHGCLYCYASSYIPRFHDCRPKKNLLTRLKREATRLNGELVSISNSSDPYPRLEQEVGLIRKCLEILAKNCCRLQMSSGSQVLFPQIQQYFRFHREPPSFQSGLYPPQTPQPSPPRLTTNPVFGGCVLLFSAN